MTETETATETVTETETDTERRTETERSTVHIARKVLRLITARGLLITLVRQMDMAANPTKTERKRKTERKMGTETEKENTRVVLRILTETKTERRRETDRRTDTHIEEWRKMNSGAILRVETERETRRKTERRIETQRVTETDTETGTETVADTAPSEDTATTERKSETESERRGARRKRAKRGLAARAKARNQVKFAFWPRQPLIITLHQFFRYHHFAFRVVLSPSYVFVDAISTADLEVNPLALSVKEDVTDVGSLAALKKWALLCVFVFCMCTCLCFFWLRPACSLSHKQNTQ